MVSSTPTLHLCLSVFWGFLMSSLSLPGFEERDRDSSLPASVSESQRLTHTAVLTSRAIAAQPKRRSVNVASLRLSDFTPSASASDLAHKEWRGRRRSFIFIVSSSSFKALFDECFEPLRQL